MRVAAEGRGSVFPPTRGIGAPRGLHGPPLATQETAARMKLIDENLSASSGRGIVRFEADAKRLDRATS